MLSPPESETWKKLRLIARLRIDQLASLIGKIEIDRKYFPALVGYFGIFLPLIYTYKILLIVACSKHLDRESLTTMLIYLSLVLL